MWNEKLSVFSLNSVYQRGEVFAYLSRFTLVHRQMHTRADSRRRATRNGRRRYIFDTVGHLPVVPPRISINNGRTPLEKAPCSFCVGVAKFIALAGVNFDPCFVRFCFFFLSPIWRNKRVGRGSIGTVITLERNDWIGGESRYVNWNTDRMSILPIVANGRMEKSSSVLYYYFLSLFQVIIRVFVASSWISWNECSHF